jgi:hypothetical protein
MLWESCSFSYKEDNKIRFAIFRFFCDLLWILQVAAETHKRGKIYFANRPLERIRDSQIYPWFAQTTLERTPAMQCSPRPRGRRGSPDSGEAGGGAGRGDLGWGLGVVGHRFRCLLVAERRPVVWCGRGRRRRRWELCSGEPAARRGQQAGVGALLVHEGGGSSTCLW